MNQSQEENPGDLMFDDDTDFEDLKKACNWCNQTVELWTINRIAENVVEIATRNADVVIDLFLMVGSLPSMKTDVIRAKINTSKSERRGFKNEYYN